MENIVGFLSIFLIFIVIRRLIKALIKDKATTQTNEGEIVDKNKEVYVEKIVIEMVKDEVCGRSIPRTEAQILVKDNKKYYFCSWDCREKFMVREKADAMQ